MVILIQTAPPKLREKSSGSTLNCGTTEIEITNNSIGLKKPLTSKCIGAAETAFIDLISHLV
jgi:hypothetical protein